ncbi:MAG: DNA repair protein RecO [Myxococcota bacterium]|nr:DNA repair protein RecO [Myxococcota bacterium]
MARPTRSVSAIVIGQTDYGEADRIVKLLTPDSGRISVMARGARRSKKRFGGTLDLGNRVEMQLVAGRGRLSVLSECTLLRGHAHVRNDLGCLALLNYACEWVGALAREEHAEPKLFGLLEVALAVLDASVRMPSATFRWGLEAKALTFAGLTPALEGCTACARELEDEACYSAQAGGLLHPECGTGRTVSRTWWEQVERARRTPLAELVDQPVADRVGLWVLHDHLEWHLGRGLRSRSMLAQLEGDGLGN